MSNVSSTFSSPTFSRSSPRSPSRSSSPEAESESECDERCGKTRPCLKLIRHKTESDKERFRAFCEERAPLLQLPGCLVVDHEAMRTLSYYTPPVKVCFGLGVRFKTVFDYAQKKGLVEEDEAQAVGFYAAVGYLRRLTRARALHVRIPVFVEELYVLALYNNHTKKKYEMNEGDEKEVLELLRKELGLPEDTPAMWYFEDD